MSTRQNSRTRPSSSCGSSFPHSANRRPSTQADRRRAGRGHPQPVRRTASRRGPRGNRRRPVRRHHRNPEVRVGRERQCSFPLARARWRRQPSRSGSAPVFHPRPAPTDEEIAQILEHIHDRVTRLLRRSGRLPEEPRPTDPVAEQMPLLAGYAAASIQELIATAPRAGHPVRRLHLRRGGGGRGEAPVRPPGGVLAPRQRRPARSRPRAARAPVPLGFTCSGSTASSPSCAPQVSPSRG